MAAIDGDLDQKEDQEVGVDTKIAEEEVDAKMTNLKNEEAKAVGVPWNFQEGSLAEGWDSDYHSAESGRPVEEPEAEQDIEEPAKDHVGKIVGCAYQGCLWSGSPRDFKTHINEECKERPVSCPYPGCHWRGRLRSLSEHTGSCGNRPCSCPCGWGGPLFKFEDHKLSCLERWEDVRHRGNKAPATASSAGGSRSEHPTTAVYGQQSQQKRSSNKVDPAARAQPFVADEIDYQGPTHRIRRRSPVTQEAPSQHTTETIPWSEEEALAIATAESLRLFEEDQTRIEAMIKRGVPEQTEAAAEAASAAAPEFTTQPAATATAPTSATTAMTKAAATTASTSAPTTALTAAPATEQPAPAKRSWRAARRDPRFMAIRSVFRELDRDKDGRLNEQELLSFAWLTGFKGTSDQWQEEYEFICNKQGVDLREGLSEGVFEAIINDRDDPNGSFCETEELVELLEKLKAESAQMSSGQWSGQHTAQAKTAAAYASAGRPSPAPARSPTPPLRPSGDEAEGENLGLPARQLQGWEAMSGTSAEKPAIPQQANIDSAAARQRQRLLPPPPSRPPAPPPTATPSDSADVAAVVGGQTEPGALGVAVFNDQNNKDDWDEGEHVNIAAVRAASPEASRTESQLRKPTPAWLPAQQEESQERESPTSAWLGTLPQEEGSREQTSPEVPVEASERVPETQREDHAFSLTDRLDWSDTRGVSVQDLFERHVESVLPTAEERHLSTSCLAALRTCLKDELPLTQVGRWSVAPFGSVANGFGTVGCDLDVVIYEESTTSSSSSSSTSTTSRSSVREMLLKLKDIFKARPDFEFTELILAARVPILRLQYGKMEVDLSVNNTTPLKNTRLLKAYSELHPSIGLLGVAVKVWAKEHGLCGAASGNLSSYAFVILVLYYLQAKWDLPSFPVEAATFAAALKKGPKWQPNAPLHILFHGFFRFYSEEFHWGKELVSLHKGRREAPKPSPYLQIEDPVEQKRNLADVLQEHQESRLYDAFCESASVLSRGVALDYPLGGFRDPRNQHHPSRQQQQQHQQHHHHPQSHTRSQDFRHSRGLGITLNMLKAASEAGAVADLGSRLRMDPNSWMYTPPQDHSIWSPPPPPPLPPQVEKLGPRRAFSDRKGMPAQDHVSPEWTGPGYTEYPQGRGVPGFW